MAVCTPCSEIPSPCDIVITEVRVVLHDAKALKAFVTVTFNHCFVARGLKVIEGTSGRFVAMPSRRKPDGTYQDIAHPITQRFRDYVEAVVMEAYERERERVAREKSAPAPPRDAEEEPPQAAQEEPAPLAPGE